MKKIFTLTIVLALVFVSAIFAGCGQTTGPVNTAAAFSTGTIILRVNPEISVAYNQDSLVTGVEGLNEDGTAIVSRYSDYVGKDCKTVIQELVQEINAAGYFVADVAGNNKSITIQIEPGSVLPTDDFLEAITADVKTTAAGFMANSNVVGIGQDDYDIRYATGTNPSEYISRDKAAEIALAHAGIAAADAIFDDREFDFENGKPVYEMEFMSGGQEYEYDIDARTGRILRNSVGDSGYGDKHDSYYGDTDYGPYGDGDTGYNNDTDYGPNNDGVTDYNDTDYGPNNDGVTDYNDTDYGPNNDGVTDYNDTDYGPNNDGVTDYRGSSSRSSGNSGNSGSRSSSGNSGNSGYSSGGYGNSGSSGYSSGGYGNSGNSGYSGGSGYGNS